MSTKTEHYQLNQWEPSDPFLRTDFNEDNAKLDAVLAAHDTALAAKCEVVLGSYTGDGASSRTITLGFQPKAVYLCTQNGLAGSASGAYYIYGGLAMPGKPLCHLESGEKAMEITTNGFLLTQSTHRQVNVKGWNYYYIALR